MSVHELRRALKRISPAVFFTLILLAYLILCFLIVKG